MSYDRRELEDLKRDFMDLALLNKGCTETNEICARRIEDINDLLANTESYGFLHRWHIAEVISKILDVEYPDDVSGDEPNGIIAAVLRRVSVPEMMSTIKNNNEYWNQIDLIIELGLLGQIWGEEAYEKIWNFKRSPKTAQKYLKKYLIEQFDWHISDEQAKRFFAEACDYDVRKVKNVNFDTKKYMSWEVYWLLVEAKLRKMAAWESSKASMMDVAALVRAAYDEGRSSFIAFADAHTLMEKESKTNG